MLGYKTKLKKLRGTEVIPSNFFLPPWCDTRSQLQEEDWEIHKYLEIKQQTTKQYWGKRNVR